MHALPRFETLVVVPALGLRAEVRGVRSSIHYGRRLLLLLQAIDSRRRRPLPRKCAAALPKFSDDPFLPLLIGAWSRRAGRSGGAHALPGAPTRRQRRPKTPTVPIETYPSRAGQARFRPTRARGGSGARSDGSSARRWTASYGRTSRDPNGQSSLTGGAGELVSDALTEQHTLSAGSARCPLIVPT
jgi:hypothetical protein